MLSAGSDHSNSLAAQVTAYVKSHGIPWAQFARHAHVSLSVLAKLRRNEPITGYSQDRLLNALGTPPGIVKKARESNTDDGLIQRLKETLQHQGITQNHLAKELGIGSAYLSRVITGQTRPYPKNYAKMQQRLDAYLGEHAAATPQLHHLLVRLHAEGTLTSDKLDRLKELI